MFNFITNSLLALAQAVVLQTMPPKLEVIHIAEAKTNSLASSVLSVELVPETQRSTIAYTEKEGEDEAMDDFDTSEGLNLNPTPKNGLDEPRQDPSKPEIVKMIKKAFPDEPLVVKIADCESELKPKAQNRHSSAKGIFQILDGTWKHFKCEGDPLNAEDNILCGKKVLDGQGLGAWSESFSCWKNL